MKKIFIGIAVLLCTIAYTQERNFGVTSGGNLIVSDGKMIIQNVPLYNDLAIAFFERCPVQPSALEKRIYSDFYDSLQVTTGYGSHLIDTLSVFYFACVGDSNYAKLNLIGDYSNLTTVNNPTFLAWFGWSGDATAAALNTNFSPIGDSHYRQNDASFGISIDSISSATSRYWGVGDGSWNSFIIPNLGGSTYGRINSGSNLIQANAYTENIYVVNRTDASNQELYIGEDKYTGSSSAVAPIDYEFYLLARNDGGTIKNFSGNNFNAGFIGGGFTEAQVLRLIR